ncbi:redoxin domain-containing protein [Marinoscillum sp. 108]|uniref:redoxin domain-containing protein n=1 Tax=Marinoscillum sp. 108 TaxID=2653151 RepID=UPI0012F2B083|nr:redoxin domain-containing protein [Marinoscillum sp. 108]VXD11470.1 Redoxin [Marinoscillum sp. 108]
MKITYLLLLLVMVIGAEAVAQDHSKKVDPLPIGSLAPDFTLPATDGNTYSLADFKKKYLAIVFTCNHCPTAQAYEKKLISIVDEYSKKGVDFVAISPNDPNAVSLSELGYSDLSDDLEDMKLRVKEMNYNFTYLYDGASQQTSLKYGPAATPHVFVFDQDRKLVYSGRIDDTENPYITPRTTDLINTLDELLAGKQPSTPTTKTFGCSIKWAWKNDWLAKEREGWSKEEVTIQPIAVDEVADLVKNTSEKLRLINIWATWCGPCVQEFPDFVDINRMYRGRDFEFVSISGDKLSKKDKALEFLTKKEASNTNYIYSGDNMYDLIEAVDPNWQGALPYTLLVAPGGKIIYQVDGTIDPYELKKAIVGYLGRFYADN